MAAIEPWSTNSLIGSPVGAGSSISAPGASEAGQAQAAPGFGDLLTDAIGQVNAVQVNADIEARKVITGQSSDLTEAVAAAEKARLAMEFTVQVRNKIVESYQELWRMPI